MCCTLVKLDSRRRRLGFTLLELMLALAIIVAIASITLPNMFDALASRQLARGADGVRVAMVQARVDAMRTGRTHLFRVQIGGDQFQVQPLNDLSDITEAADQMGRGTAAATGGIPVATLATNPATTPLPAADDRPRDLLEARMDDSRLPDGVLFGELQVQATARSATLQQQAAATAGQWSEPVLFYADGTTSNAVVSVGREGYGRILVKLRGLTGDTIVSEVLP